MNETTQATAMDIYMQMESHLLSSHRYQNL